MRLKIFAILTALLLIPCALAHLEAGEDRQIGDVEADFGYAPNDLIAGEDATITIGLAKQNIPTTEPVWVRISRKEVITFSSELVPTGGAVSLSYTFPQGGTYDITVRGEGIDTTFTVTVHDQLPWLWISIASLAGLLIGLLAGWKMRK